MSGRFNTEPFASPGYRRWFLAVTLAAFALWAYTPAMEWIVLTSTGRAGAVGLLQTSLVVAVAIATLPSGDLAERFGARRTMAVALAGIGVMILLVAIAAGAGALSFEVALALTFVLGIFDGLYGVPATLLLQQVVDPRFLGAAIGLSFLTSGIGRLVGGPLGGASLETFGAAQAFVPAAIVLVISAVVVLTMPVRRADERPERAATTSGLREAVRWMARHRAALWVTVLGTVSGLSVFCYSALMPAYTRDILHADAATLGVVAGGGGLGTIFGAVLMDPVGRRIGRGRQVVVTFLGCGASLALLALTESVVVAVALAVAITTFAIQFGGTAQLIVQAMPPARVRARVLAVYTFAFYCALPLGTAMAGGLADAVGVRTVLLGMAALTAVATALVLLAYPRLLAVDTDARGAIREPGQPAAPEVDPTGGEGVGAPEGVGPGGVGPAEAVGPGGVVAPEAVGPVDASRAAGTSAPR